MKNENLRLSIYILFTLALSFTVLFGCGGDDTSIDHTIIIDPSTCRDCPFTVSASISPNQDLAMATQAENITITFNEPMAEINLDLIRLEVLGFKGGEVPLGADILPDVPIATRLSPDTKTLIIDIDPDHEPNTPLAPGRVFAVTGFEALFGANGKPFDAQNPNNVLPAIQPPFSAATARFLRFTTHAGAAALLALSAAPVQASNTAQNTSSFFGTATLDIEFSAQAPSGARAFRVFASPGGSVTEPALFCKVFESGFADHPPTALSIPLVEMASALSGCHRPLKNTQWDEGLTIDVAVSAINDDGEEGPLSAILTAKDNVNPRISAGFPLTGPGWFAGSPAGTFQIQIQFTEEMDERTLTDPANYTIRSVDADSYTVTSVTIPFNQGNPTTINLTFTLTSGSVSNGDTITLGQAIVDEAGNPIDSGADTLRVEGFSIIIQ